MATSSEEAQVRATSDAAQNFIDWYYTALNDKKPLAPFYVDNNAKYAAAGLVPDISANGARLAGGPAELEALLQKHTGSGSGAAHRSRYEVEGFDAQTVNPDFRVACPDHLLGSPAPQGPRASRSGAGGAAQHHGRISVMVTVTGWVQYGAGKEAPRSTFSEVFVLVPNWDAMGSKAPRGLKGWLIMSQNFRAL